MNEIRLFENQTFSSMNSLKKNAQKVYPCAIE